MPGPVNAAEGTFNSKGVKIRYVTEGTGEPVVLIHGWMADSTMWGRDPSGNTKLDTTRAQGFQLIALDCRGHGKSDKPHDPGKYGAEMAADVVRLLDHLKIKRAHLVGYSMGAFIAGRVAATQPERVRSVVFGGQAPLIIGAKSSGSSEVEVFAKAVDEGKGLGSYLLAVTPPGKRKPTVEQANALAAYLYTGKDVKAFAASGRSLKHLAVTGEQLRRCRAPILFIHGGNESDSVKNRVASVRQLLGRGEVKVVQGSDHVTTLTNPEFGSSVLQFLRSSRAR
jgi:pimeloyl-ACP methyl ester carboxylesterase